MNNHYNTPTTVWQQLLDLPTVEDANLSQLWNSVAYLDAVDNIDNIKKSMAVLKKHLPQHFHPLIRFAQPKTIWYLNVEKGITATQINQLLDDLCLRIGKDIGYAPRLKVAVKATQWAASGLPLSVSKPPKISLPSREEAADIIAEFLSRPHPKI